MCLPALSLLLFTALATADAPKDKDADKPKAGGVNALVGDWQLASTADENRGTPGNKLSRMAVSEGGRVRFLLGDRQMNSGTFVPARAAGKLKAIDLKLNCGRVLLCVYALDGDALVMCFAEEGKPRPASLKPRGTQWAERWVRPNIGGCVRPPGAQPCEGQ